MIFKSVVDWLTGWAGWLMGSPFPLLGTYVAKSIKHSMSNSDISYYFSLLPTPKKTMFQNYDPDLPPEPAAAAGIHEISADNTNLEKAEVGHTDTATGSMGARPQLVCFQVLT